jgi:hypothetical protein
VEKSTFHHQDLLTHNQVLQRVMSTSYITLMDESQREELTGDVVSVMNSLSEPVAMPYATNVFTAFAE